MNFNQEKMDLKIKAAQKKLELENIQKSLKKKERYADILRKPASQKQLKTPEKKPEFFQEEIEEEQILRISTISDKKEKRTIEEAEDETEKIIIEEFEGIKEDEEFLREIALWKAAKRITEKHEKNLRKMSTSFGRKTTLKEKTGLDFFEEKEERSILQEMIQEPPKKKSRTEKQRNKRGKFNLEKRLEKLNASLGENPNDEKKKQERERVLLKLQQNPLFLAKNEEDDDVEIKKKPDVQRIDDFSLASN